MNLFWNKTAEPTLTVIPSEARNLALDFRRSCKHLQFQGEIPRFARNDNVPGNKESDRRRLLDRIAAEQIHPEAFSDVLDKEF